MNEYVYVLVESLASGNGGVADAHHAVFVRMEDAVEVLKTMAKSYPKMTVNNSGTCAKTREQDEYGYTRILHKIEIHKTKVIGRP